MSSCNFKEHRRKKSVLFLTTILVICLIGLTGCSSQNAIDVFTTAEQSADNHRSPDFGSLQKQNPDICAWLYIPEAKVNAPVFYSSDDSKYSDYRLYIQGSYNDPDFKNPATVIYGPLTYDGTLFGSLQKVFSEDNSISKAEYFTVYTPDGILRYKPFAATLFRDTHLLHKYNRLETSQDRDLFLYDLKNYHVLSSQWDEKETIEKDEKLLILSCHTLQNEDLRYLVLAKEVH